MAVLHCCKGDAASQWEMAILGYQNSVIPEPIDFLLMFKRNEMPICKGLGDTGRFSITGSDVMPISPLGGAKFQIRPHIVKAHWQLPISSQEE